MPYEKETDLFRYQYWEVRSINDTFVELKGDKDAIYSGGIDFYRRGAYLYTLLNPLAIAEFIADYTRACEACGIAPSNKIGYEKRKEMVAILNGES